MTTSSTHKVIGRSLRRFEGDYAIRTIDQAPPVDSRLIEIPARMDRSGRGVGEPPAIPRRPPSPTRSLRRAR